MLQTFTVESKTLDLAKKILAIPELQKTRLVGGTGCDDEIRIAGLKDIAAMKLSAITNCGTKKDFVDIFYLLKKFPLSEMLDFYMQKYYDGSKFMVLKCLSYFNDAEAEPLQKMYEK